MKDINPNIPYNDLPLLPLKRNFESKEILLKLINTRSAISEIKGLSEVLPNPAILINTITLQEAKDSSEIENIVTTHDELYMAFSTKDKELNPQIKEVLNYREALWFGYNKMKKQGFLTINNIISIQRIIIENDAGIRNTKGTALKNIKTGKIIYTPPNDEEYIKKLLTNLEKYINNNKNDIDPLIKMAIIHYQFEAIHPFYDGNGRTGRILNILYLMLKDLLNLPILYLSSYIIKEKSKYYKLLSEIRTKNNWEGWILFILDIIEKTAKETISLIKDIRIAFHDTVKIMKKDFISIYSKDLVETLFESLYCKSAFIVEKGLYERKTAMKHLESLEKAGILKSIIKGRQKLFLNIRLNEILKKYHKY